MHGFNLLSGEKMTKTDKLSIFFGDKNFYKKVLTIAIPIMVQNGITNFVNLLDNIMVGNVGTEQMSAVAIVNKLMFVFILCLFGGCAGVGIFTAQYFGKGDYEGVKKTFRLKLLTNLAVLAIAFTVTGLFQDNLISLYLNDIDNAGNTDLIFGYAKQYIAIIMIGMIPQAVTEAFSSTLRETEHTKLPMVAGGCAVLTNLCLNYVLIFGHFGAPALGVQGAAIATVISKFVELAIIAVVIKAKSDYSFLHGAFKTLLVPVSFVKQVLPKSIPLLLNETGWAMGVASLAFCYSLRGTMVVAGFNISSTITDIFNVVSLAFGNAIAIMVGNLLGADKMEEAKKTTWRMITFSVLISIGLGIILFSCSSLFPMLYSGTDAEAKFLASSFLKIYSVYLLINTVACSCYFTLRSGGKTFITFIFDSIFMLCVAFPFTYVFATFTSLPIVPLYALSLSVDILKCVIGLILIKSGKWMQNIVK